MKILTLYTKENVAVYQTTFSNRKAKIIEKTRKNIEKTNKKSEI